MLKYAAPIAALICCVFASAGFAQSTQPTSNTPLFTIELPTKAREAINNGVALSFNCDFAVRKSYWLLTLNHKKRQHQFRLSRHALSNRYIVHRDDLQTPHIFRSINGATNYIASQSLKLLESYYAPNTPYSMKLSLNKFDLPGPMRLDAFISQDWQLNTRWVSWQFEN